MTISWGTALKPKYLSFVFGSGWEKSDFRMIGYRKTPLGWDLNIWRISISYDNYANVRVKEE